MAGRQSLRALAARDKDFLGVDVVAMARLIQQMNAASDAIAGWLRANAALPPSVPRTGLHQATAVESWVHDQRGGLTRRRDYAISHLNRKVHTVPATGTGGLGAHPHHVTSAGAGHHVGHFPDVRGAVGAGAADGATARRAIEEHHPVPDAVWRHLVANAGDPDHARAFYDRLGPAGVAALAAAAPPGSARREAVETSLGVASHHMDMGEAWMRTLLGAAAREGVRADALQVLAGAHLDRRAKVALAHLGLLHLTENPPHRFPQPRPPHQAAAGPHEAMMAPAAGDPHAAAELYSRHPADLHRALTLAPSSPTLARLVEHATTSAEADPAMVRANAERLAGFDAGGRAPEDGS